MSTDHNLFQEKGRAEAESSRGPTVDQPNALALVQTGSQLIVVLIAVWLLINVPRAKFHLRFCVVSQVRSFSSHSRTQSSLVVSPGS